jgi:hypothetical protein
LVCASVVASCFTLFGCARLQSCSGEQPVTERAQSPLSAANSDSAANGKTGNPSKSRHNKRPVIKNTGDAWLALKFFLPDILEGYRARMAIEGRDISLGADLGLLSVRRAYGNKEDLVIEVELIDVTACERVRDLFNRSRELQRDTEKAVIRPMRVHGQKALSQWLDATKTARTSVLVADRFLVNANVKPADSTARLGRARTVRDRATRPARNGRVGEPAAMKPERVQGATPNSRVKFSSSCERTLARSVCQSSAA